MIFHYIAISQDGTKSEGEIDVLDQNTAISSLQKRGLTIVNIEEKKENESLKKIKSSFTLFKPHIKSKDIVIFSRQIATLFEAGVSALKAFRLLATENDNKALRDELTGVADDIESGVAMSEALSRRPKIFSPFYVNMVRAGEESGKLNEGFLYLADYMDRDYELKQKVKKALTYPAFVVATFIIIMIAMFTFVIPKMAELFSENGATLPLVTRIVLGISSVFVEYGPITFPVLIVLGWLFYRWTKTESGKYKFDGFIIRVPILHDLFQRLFLTRFADNMSTMLSSGVPIVKSIDITEAVVDNVVHKEVLSRISNKVQNGVSLSKALYDEPLIPNILVQMVRIGEETGEIGYILKSLSTFYKRELDTTIDNMISLIEPAMIVGLGLGVGILVSSVLLPMYSLSSAIS